MFFNKITQFTLFISKRTIPFFYTLLLLILLGTHAYLDAMAVIKNAVAEMNSSFPTFHHQPAAPQNNKCYRAHQGLNNEIVRYIEEQDEYAKIAYDVNPNEIIHYLKEQENEYDEKACNTITYGFDNKTQAPLNTFWAHKCDLCPITPELSPELVQAIPHPVYGKKPTIRLLYPWKSSAGYSFSLGTRFKHVPEHDTPQEYAILHGNFSDNTVSLDYIPHTDALIEQPQNASSARKLCVKISNYVVDRVSQDNPGHVIPYVWGGSSFIQAYNDNDLAGQPAFYQEDGVWHREGAQNPYTGYDCSEFVMRMAQMAGIHFPWKTSAAIERSLKALDHHDVLQEGDIIWTPGHVMMVSNLENNELIEARGYSSGYGCVHRISLHECFAEVTTYQELLQQYYANKTIKYKDKYGVIGEKAYNFKLLKLIN